MRTNIDIDDRLMEKAMKSSGQEQSGPRSRLDYDCSFKHEHKLLLDGSEEKFAGGLERSRLDRSE